MKNIKAIINKIIDTPPRKSFADLYKTICGLLHRLERRVGLWRDPWKYRKADLLQGVDENQVSNLNILLDNTKRYIEHTMSHEGSEYSKLHDMLPDLVAQTYKNLACKYLIGVQTMQGPVGLVYTLQYRNNNEEGEGRRTLNIVSDPVEASSKNLHASWSIEPMRDLNDTHGLDIEKELVKVCGAEFALDIDQEVFSLVKKIASHRDTIDFGPSAEMSSMDLLGVKINKMCNDIASATRRGTGNWILTSPTIVSILQRAPLFVPAVEGSFKNTSGTQLAGVLNGTIEVYSTFDFSTDQTVDTIVIGYKGKAGEIDCGLVYAPYILIMPVGIVMNPITFVPVMKFMTRYGFSLRNQEDLIKSADYYGVINVTNIKALIQ